MFLYNNENGMIEVYALKYYNDELSDFRKEEMKKIPADKRFFYACTNYEHTLANFSEITEWRNLEWSDLAWLIPHYGGSCYHLMFNHKYTAEEQNRQEELLEYYYFAHYLSNPTVKVVIDDESKRIYDIDEDFKYFILTQTKYEPQLPRGDYTMENILSVTKPLYLLQLFQQEQFKKLTDEDVSQLSQLFNLSEEPIERIPVGQLDNLKCLDMYNNYDEKMSKVTETQRVLYQLKKTK